MQAARRHPYSWRYGPVNKADVLVKWFASPVRHIRVRVRAAENTGCQIAEPGTVHLGGPQRGCDCCH